MSWLKKKVPIAVPDRPEARPWDSVAEMQQYHYRLMGAVGTPHTPLAEMESDPEPVAVEVIAWRGWQLDPTDEWEPVLKSFSRPVRWDGPTLTADKVPSRHHEHGIYGLKATPGIRHAQSGYYYNAFAFGCVALSGVVVEGERGYRAERATIRELWICNPASRGVLGDRYCALELAGMLEQRYQVDVHQACENWADWQAMAEHQALHNSYIQYGRF